jgi:hypothetical protein
MKFIREWWWLPLCLLLAPSFVIFVIFGNRLQGYPKPPDWAPNGDPLLSMSHNDALICWGNSQAYPTVDQFELVVTWMPGAAGDHVFLYPSQRGECGILPVSDFGLNPVSVLVRQVVNAEWHRYQVTSWSPTHRGEPDPPFDWSTTTMTEDSSGWRMVFVPTSSNQPRPVVEIRAE